MIKQLEMTGKNKDEAISRALAQLGMDRDDVSVEILEMGKTGFLGIGSVPAKVRVTYEVPGEAEAAPRKPVIPEIPVVEAVPVKPAPRPTKAPVEPRVPKAERVPKPRKETRSATAPKPPKAPQVPAPVAPAPVEDSSTLQAEGAEERIEAFLTGLLKYMDVFATPRITRDGDTYDVVLEGENLGTLIGRRGETLDAIQQLTGYAVNKNRSKRVRIHMDAENYRARREESLHRLATKVAGKVLRYHRSVTLEPMNAYERHVIHAALQDYKGVTTHSIGVEPNRRVVVSCDMEK